MGFLNRLLVSLIFVPVMLLVFYLGGAYLFGFMGIILVMMLHELRENFRSKGIDLPVTIQVFGLMVYVSIQLPFEYLVGVVFVGLVITSGNYLFRNHTDGSIKKMAITWFSIFYTAIPLALVVYMRNISNDQIDGRILMISLLVVIWLTDTMAYLTGILIGKRKGIIKVSPNKSLEGYIGGLLFSIITSLVAVYLFMDFKIDLIWILVLSGGIFGQYGDLFESMIKRDLQIKDSSRILKNHGGILDRFDSLLLAAPALYILLKIMGYF